MLVSIFCGTLLSLFCDLIYSLGCAGSSLLCGPFSGCARFHVLWHPTCSLFCDLIYSLGCAGSSLLCGPFSGCKAGAALLLRSAGSRALGSAAVTCGLGSRGSRPQDAGPTAVHELSCPVVRGVFPDQALKPCLLRWQADSLPLSHQGSLPFSLCSWEINSS